MVMSGQLHDPATSTHGRIPARAHWIWDWVGNRVDLDAWEKGQVSCLYWEPAHNFLEVQSEA